MASSEQTRTTGIGRTLVPPMLTLAWQRIRKTWGLLLMVELGMVGAVLLACVVPLYTNVTLTATLRGTLNSAAQNSEIVVHTQALMVSSTVLNATTQSLNKELNTMLGPYLDPAQTSFSIETPMLPFSAGSRGSAVREGMGLIGAEMNQAAAHLKLVSGRLPQPAQDALEIALTPETASFLHVNPGDTLAVNLMFTDVYQTPYPQQLNLRVVGLFTPTGGSDTFWHGETFASSQQAVFALIPNEILVDTLARYSTEALAYHHVIASDPNVSWYYGLDVSRISSDDLNYLIAGIQQVQIANANSASQQQSDYLEQMQTSLLSPDALEGLAQRISVIEFPVLSLVVIILSLLLFFIGLIVNLLIERQGEAIALLRSRGGTRGQILGALVLQGFVIAALALLVGLWLAPWVVRLLTWQMFAGNDQGALNIIGGLTQTALRVGIYALLAIGVALLTIIVTVWIASRRDIVSLRRETSRSMRKPAWQRLRLDFVAVLIALAGYGFSVYVLNSNVLDSQLYLLLLSPLALLQTIFLLLAELLLFFRFYPALLRLGTKLAAGRRSAPPVLGLAQIARAPRHATRVTMLLAFSSAFAIFALIFTASQAQRVLDVSSYQAGADFSGTIPVPASYSPADLSKETGLYKSVPGVLGASLGFTAQAQAGGVLRLALNFQAVDASTFAQAASWSAQDSSQSLAGFMQTLSAQRDTAIGQRVVPALVDANTWNTLHLSPGANFTLLLPNVILDREITLKVLAEVQHIPTSGNTATPGVLVDYSTFARVYTGNFNAHDGKDAALNAVWVRTADDARSLASVRSALTTGELRLAPLYDRRAIESALSADPVYLSLVGELELGTGTSLFLALLGCLLASWLSVRSRLTNFTTLRALGATPRQVISTLMWEQGIIYTAAVLLGILFGALLSLLSLPSLILTSVQPSQATGSVSNTNFYAAQFVPPLQVIIPVSLWIILGALAAICLLALGLMVHNVARSSINLVLRLSED